MYKRTPKDIAIVKFTMHLPIPSGAYPLFTGYPKFIIEHQA